MNTTETLKILAVLETAYKGRISGGNTDMTVSLWSASFANESYEDVSQAVMKFINSDIKGFPPVPGQIHMLVGEIKRARDCKLIEVQCARNFESALCERKQLSGVYIEKGE